jgi:hypothetical protein
MAPTTSGPARSSAAIDRPRGAGVVAAARSTAARLGPLVIALVVGAAACARAEPSAPGRAASAPAPAVPWQPHGLRVPTTRCEFALPEGFARSTAPMPDHIAELTKPTSSGIATIVVAERVEADLPAASERVRAYWAAGPLTQAGAAVARDEALTDASVPGWALSLRTGAASERHEELVVLLAFEHAPVVEVVARHAVDDAASRDAVLALANSLRCS